MARKTGEPTLAAEIYTTLRREILTGRLTPGSPLRVSPLSDRLDVSPTVVREALTRLSEQGLVWSIPQSGFQVTTLSVEDLGDLSATRIEIESLAIRDAIAHGTLEWESSLVAAHHSMTRTPLAQAGDVDRISDEWALAHSTFHKALINGCHRPRLRGIALSLWDASELYRRWSGEISTDRDIATEHLELLDAVLDRDADLAVRVLEVHIGETARVLLERLGLLTDSLGETPSMEPSGVAERRGSAPDAAGRR